MYLFVWGSGIHVGVQGQLELVLYFHHVSSEIRTRVIRFSHTCLYSLSHFAGPHNFFSEESLKHSLVCDRSLGNKYSQPVTEQI